LINDRELSTHGHSFEGLIKFNSSGDIIWAHQNQTGASYYDIEIGPNNSIYLAGSRDSTNSGSNRRQYLLALDSNGQIVWIKQDGPTTGSNIIYDIAVDSASNVYFVAQYSAGNNQTVKLNSSGSVLWSINYGTAQCRSLTLTNQQKIVVAGKITTSSLYLFGNSLSNGVFISCIDSNGNVSGINSGDLFLPNVNEYFVSNAHNSSDGIIQAILTPNISYTGGSSTPLSPRILNIDTLGHVKELLPMPYSITKNPSLNSGSYNIIGTCFGQKNQVITWLVIMRTQT
jgi:hypothetical protein